MPETVEVVGTSEMEVASSAAVLVRGLGAGEATGISVRKSRAWVILTLLVLDASPAWLVISLTSDSFPFIADAATIAGLIR